MIELLSGVAGLLVEVGRLDAGDYLVDNRVLVERKTIADLASSIADGRLFTQAHRMAGGRLIPVLIIEGAVPQHGIAGMTREAVQGAIISLALSFGVPSLRSRDLRDTANLLRFVADQIRRRSANAVQRHGYRPRGARKRRLFILQGLPGIGPARAERLLDTFGSVESVFQAGQRDLAEVAGIGRATAAKIRSLVAAPASADDERVG
jgi:Fanconi anemia group M protein